jgi:2,4'-dihydroxyacetophenone dioxygenase
MLTLFQVRGAMIYVDSTGKVLGFDDVFTKIERCQKHFELVWEMGCRTVCSLE